MSVNKFKDGELVKVSKGSPNASEIYYKDDNGWLNTTNVKDSIKTLDEKKINIDNILNTYDEVDASTNADDIASASSVKELNAYYDTLLKDATGIKNGLFRVRSFQTPSYFLDKNQVQYVDLDIGLSGYTPIAILGYYCPQAAYCFNATINNTTNVISLAFKATRSAVWLGGVYYRVFILYIKNNSYFIE